MWSTIYYFWDTVLQIDLLEVNNLWKLMLGFISICLVYRYLVRPINYVKDLESVGYWYLNKGVYSKQDGTKLAKNGRNLGKLPPVFPNGWFMIAESSDIAVNQVLHISALGENFVLFRSADRQCHVLDAYCPHLGANMGIGGKVHGDCIECPFHQWRFSGITGKCISVPYSSKVPNFAEVKCWNVHEINDMIFVWYHSEDEPPTWYPNSVDSIENRKFIYRGRNQFLVNCHIQDIPENGSDLWHFNAVHGASMLTGSDIHQTEATWCKFFRHNWSAEWEPGGEPSMKHIGFGKLSHFISLFGKIKLASLTVDIEQIGPGYVIMRMHTTIGPMVILQAVTPVEPMIQKVVHRFYCPIYLALYATLTLVAESIMVERDIMIWNHKKFIENPLLLKEDKTVAKYRRWFNQFYSEHSPLFNTKKQCLD